MYFIIPFENTTYNSLIFEVFKLVGVFLRFENYFNFIYPTKIFINTQLILKLSLKSKLNTF
jgi:hypothetical protein